MSHSHLYKLLAAFLPFSLLAQEEPLPETTQELIADLAPQEESDLAYLGEPVQTPLMAPSLPTFLEPAPVALKPTKSPTIAVLLSGLLPGLGHYYLGEPQIGNRLLGSSLLVGAGAYATYRLEDRSLTAVNLFTLQAIRCYGLYAAYRDAHLYNGNSIACLPREDFKQLTAAPFQWSVLKKPEVWGGYLGALSAGTAVVYFAFAAKPLARLNTTYVEPLNALPIAISEESLFRGLLQTSLSEKLPPWAAITLSSLAFGAAHIPNASHMSPDRQRRYYTCSLPLITSLGAYMGWMTYKNHSLKESVALHAWYDFTLIGLGVLANRASIGEEAHMNYFWEF